MIFPTAPAGAGRAVCAALAILAQQILTQQASAQPAAKQPLTVARALETARFMISHEAIGPANPDGAVSISPSGQRYLIRAVRGDVERNGVWMEMMTGRLDLLAAASPKPVARLFTSGLGASIGSFGSDQDVMDYIPLRWLNDTQVVFLWSDEHSIRQLTRVDLISGKVDRLTSHPTPVSSFDLHRGGTVLYTAKARAPKCESWNPEVGFALPHDVDAYSLFHGNLCVTGFDVAWNTEWFVRDGGSSAVRPIRIAGRHVDLDSWHPIEFAPDGNRALVTSAPAHYPEEWNRYDSFMREKIIDARRDPRSPAARGVRQLYVMDVASGTSRPLWNTVMSVSQTRWSEDGRLVLVAPAYLPPPEADAAALEGHAAVIVDAASGRYSRLPVDLRGQRLSTLRWLGADEVEIETRKADEGQRQRFRKQGAQWALLPDTGKRQKVALPRVRIELRQDLNTPPTLHAVELQGGTPTGREQMILDPNPGLLDQVAFGRVELVDGKLESGDQWRAYLFYPVGYRPGQRYPLLIQSVYGADLRSQFTLSGYGGLGPTLIAPYPGRIVASRGVAVLHINVLMGQKFGTAAEAETRKNAFVAAAEQMVAAGIADRTKIGLAGFSRNGWYVEYTLTHSDFPFAAAVAADNWDPSYVATAWFGNIAASAAVNGAEPFGGGLNKWLDQAPGFNADRVRVPLLKIEQSTGGLFGVMAHWELISRLRYLGRPVEYYVMPKAATHGAHNTQNPGQIMAVQQRAVDWFDFWLNGHEDASAQKAAQYENWRRLREQHRANLAKPAAQAGP